ncbi:MAG: tetratricopeptide repeat protein [Planctomycetota bacterium]
MRDAPHESTDWFERRATITVIVLAVGVGLLRAFGRDVGDLLLDPGRVRYEPWRFLTATLVHGGAAHLFFNVVALSSFGRVLEPILGLGRTAATYALLAAGSMAAEFAFWGENPVGLSGIVFGQVGILWALTRWHAAFRGLLPEATARWAIGLFFVLVGLDLAGVLRIANVAHLAGALLGVLIGRVLSFRPARRRRWEWVAPVLVLCIVALAIFGRRHVKLSRDVGGSDLGSRGLTALQADEPERALELLERAVELDPDDHRLWQNLGAARMQVGQLEAALEAFERASSVRPSYWRARASARQVRLDLAQAALLAAEYAKALRYLDAALTADPGDADAHALRGVALEALGDFEAALEAYDFALAIGTSQYDFPAEYRERVRAKLEQR